jgi:hypothetical protein
MFYIFIHLSWRRQDKRGVSEERKRRKKKHKENNSGEKGLENVGSSALIQ